METKLRLLESTELRKDFINLCALFGTWSSQRGCGEALFTPLFGVLPPFWRGGWKRNVILYFMCCIICKSCLVLNYNSAQEVSRIRITRYFIHWQNIVLMKKRGVFIMTLTTGGKKEWLIWHHVVWFQVTIFLLFKCQK